MTKTRKIISLLAVLLTFVLVAAACGDDDSGNTDSSDDGTGGEETDGDGDGVTEPSAEPLRVALVLPSSPGDFGISQGVSSGIALIQTERGGESGLEIASSENMFVVDDAASAIRDFASRGFDVIIAASSAYGSSIEEIAPDFPDVSFVWGTNPETFGLDNVYAFSVRSEQGGYVGGVMAALLNDNIGFVGPIDVGSIAGSLDGFTAGANAANPSVTILDNFTNSFSDAALASEAARAMLASDVAVLSSQTEMGTGVATVAEEEGIAFFGNDADFSPVAPTQTYASQVFIYEVAFRKIFEQVEAGTLGGEVIWLEFANGGIEIVYNDGFALPDDVRAAGDQAIADITSGDVTVALGG